jgi:hypothetical protein
MPAADADDIGQPSFGQLRRQADELPPLFSSDISGRQPPYAITSAAA